MFRPKYKLVCTAGYQDYKAGDIVTTADTETHYGGPWGWIQDEGKAAWQPNFPTLAEINADNNAGILSQITSLESLLIRPMRELLSTEVTDKSFAQAKIDDIEKQTQALRAQLVK